MELWVLINGEMGIYEWRDGNLLMELWDFMDEEIGIYECRDGNL